MQRRMRGAPPATALPARRQGPHRAKPGPRSGLFSGGGAPTASLAGRGRCAPWNVVRPLERGAPPGTQAMPYRFSFRATVDWFTPRALAISDWLP